MGAPMARRLVDAGHDVIVWNRTRSRCEGFPRVAETPAEAVTGVDVAITIVSDPDAVRDVVFTSGLAKALRPDAVFIDMSTIGVLTAKRLHETIERATLDAPVGGGVAQAVSGELTVLVGGDERAPVATSERWTAHGRCWRSSVMLSTAGARPPVRR
jgi:3-hydroxyisobutyrate dehydrogenase-like beta-hydroxyacid dehydrogenase